MCVCSFCHADTAIVRCSPFHGPDFDPCLKWRVLEEFHGCKRFRRHNECWHLKRGWYIGSILGRREPVLTQSETISHWIEWRTSLQKIAEETNVICQILNFLKIQKIAYQKYYLPDPASFVPRTLFRARTMKEPSSPDMWERFLA